MVLVITSFRRGTKSYLSGTRVDSTGKLVGWSCNTIESAAFYNCSYFGAHGPGYITQTCYNTLTDSERAACPRLYRGLVKDLGYFVYTHTYYDKPRYKFDAAAIIPYPEDDPCKDVSCADTCVGVDKYDQVCQDGICVRGTLIETDSVHCGYTPEPTPDPTPTPSSDTFIIVALVLAGTYMILRR